MHPVLRQIQPPIPASRGRRPDRAPRATASSGRRSSATASREFASPWEEGRFRGGERPLSPPPFGGAGVVVGGGWGDAVEGRGLARDLGDEVAERSERLVESHPGVQLKGASAPSGVPEDNVLRDARDYTEGRGERESARDLAFRAGRELDRQAGGQDLAVVRARDFEEPTGAGSLSVGAAQTRAADLVTAYQQTVKAESSFQQYFNSTLRTLLGREETTVGLMYLWDFVQAMIENPRSRALTAQLFLVAQHSRDDGVFRATLLSLWEPGSRWLVDLVEVLQSIVVQERRLSLEERVAAINYAVLTLGRYYSRRVFKTRFVPLDKELKVVTFYMRMTMKVLVLSEELGAYRNARLERQVGSGRGQRELHDAELLSRLQAALRRDNPRALAGGAAGGALHGAGGGGGSGVGVGQTLGAGTLSGDGRARNRDDSRPEFLPEAADEGFEDDDLLLEDDDDAIADDDYDYEEAGDGGGWDEDY